MWIVRADVRIRSAVVAAVAFAGLAACTTGGGNSPSKTASSAAGAGRPATTTAHAGGAAALSGYCAKLVEAADKVSVAEGALYGGGGGGQAAIDTLVGELKALQNGAPPDVGSALSDMITAFQTAEDVLRHPTQQNEAQIAALGTKLSADGQKISGYLTSKCAPR
jgi:hypothetical protein